MRLYEVIHDPGANALLMVMEFVDGGPLLQATPAPERKVRLRVSGCAHHAFVWAPQGG